MCQQLSISSLKKNMLVDRPDGMIPKHNMTSHVLSDCCMFVLLPFSYAFAIGGETDLG